jgi:hypothetical protein
MTKLQVMEIKRLPYETNDGWVVDVFLITEYGIESTHVLCKTYAIADEIKIGDVLN